MPSPPSDSGSAPQKAAIQLRLYAPSDFDALHAIDQACYEPEIAYSRSTLREFLKMPGAECLVAFEATDSGSILGGFIIAKTSGENGHIITLDVLPMYRRSKVGSALLQSIEERMLARGVWQVELETAITNAAGIAFWQQHGYRKMGVLRGYYPGRLDAWKMRKNLRQESGVQ